MRKDSLAARLKRYMFERDLTQKEAASTLGISSFTIWKILADNGYEPGERVIFKIERGLNV